MKSQGSLLRFGCVGAVNTALGLALIFGSQAVLGFGDVAANATGYGLALLAGFALNRQWTFSDQGPATRALPRYLLVLAAAYLANLACLLFVRDALGWPSAVAQVIAILPYAAIGYAGSRWFAFAPETSCGARRAARPPAARAGTATR